MYSYFLFTLRDSQIREINASKWSINNVKTTYVYIASLHDIYLLMSQFFDVGRHLTQTSNVSYLQWQGMYLMLWAEFKVSLAIQYEGLNVGSFNKNLIFFRLK